MTHYLENSSADHVSHICSDTSSTETNTYAVCFIISLKYYRNYETYIKYYVDNIQKIYENHLIIIVDNNSVYIQDIHKMFENYKNVIIITNNDECKFEIGAYNVGIKYLIANNLIENYHYYVFTQDNFVLKNKYDFNFLLENNIHACPIHNWLSFPDFERNAISSRETYCKLIKMLNLEDCTDALSLCWCLAFVLQKSKILDYFEITRDVVITTRSGSEEYERCLSLILYYLNNKVKCSLDGCVTQVNYDYISGNIYDNNTTRYFIKKLQQKTENTVDIPP